MDFLGRYTVEQHVKITKMFHKNGRSKKIYVSRIIVRGLFSQHQSRYHSMLTTLTAVVNDILGNWDSGNCTVLMLLDFSKAFDTTNQGILLAIKHPGFSHSEEYSTIAQWLKVVGVEVLCKISQWNPPGVDFGPIILLIPTLAM